MSTSVSTDNPPNCSDMGTSDFLSYLTAHGASPETVRAYRSDLAGFMTEHLALETWPAQEVAMASYLTAHRSRLAPRTTVRRLQTFKSWARWAGAPSGFLDDYRAPTPERPTAHPIPEGTDGVLAMIESSANVRHQALLCLCGLMGLRVSEAVAVRPEHVDLEHGRITVRGKGDKTRVVPIPRAADPYLRRACVIADRLGVSLVDRTESGARKSIRRHGVRAGLSGPVASHDLRATTATAAYRRSGDIRAVQEILGHASLKTTQVYVEVTEHDMRAALEV